MQKKFAGVALAALIVGILVGAQFAFAAPNGREAVSGAQSVAAGVAHRLANSVPTRLLNVAHDLAPVPGSDRIAVTLPLTLPNSTALSDFVSGEYDKSSPNYHHFLKPEQFAQRFGAPRAEIDAVKAGLKAVGLTSLKTSANGLYVTAIAPVSAVTKAFGTPIHEFAASHPLGLLGIKRFYSNTQDIVVPKQLSGLVTGVIGLNDADAPQPNLSAAQAPRAQRLKLGVKPAATAPVGTGGGTTPCAAAVAGGGYTAPQLATAYNFNGMYSAGYHGEGMSAALVEFDDYHDSNVSGVESCYGVTTPVSRRLVDGGVGGPPAAGEAEDMADISVLLEMLPKLGHLYVYEAPADSSLATPSDQGDSEVDLYNAFVTDDLSPVLSSSWGNCEEFNSAAYEVLLSDITEEAAAQGQQIFDAAGDSGAVDCRGYPQPISSSISAEAESALPWVTGVGGTDLSQETAATGLVHREDVWNSSGAGGGGQSNFFSMPSWQQAYLTATKDIPNGLGGNCNSSVVVSSVQYCRMVPDISLDADNDAGMGPSTPDFVSQGDSGSLGYSVYCATVNCSLAGVTTGTPVPGPGGLGGWEPIGGTSLATPLAASAAVLWDQEAKADGLSGGLGFLNPDLYQVASNKTSYASDFYDITVNSNSDQYGGCTAPACNPSELYNSGTGYDMASGLGAINVPNLGADLIKNAATLDVTPSTEAMYGYTTDPTDPGQPGPSTTAVVAVTGGAFGGTYDASSDQPWLKVSDTGSAPGSLKWSVDPAGLSVGTYTGTITITGATANSAGSAPVTLTVTYTVTPPAKLAVAQPSLGFAEPAVKDDGTGTTAACGSTLWGDELLNDANSTLDNGGTTTYTAPASSQANVTVSNTGATGSQLHYAVDYESNVGAWLSTDLDPGGKAQTVPSQSLVPTTGTVAAGASSKVPLASVANGNVLGGYPQMNQGTYTGLVQVVDLADPAVTISVPAQTVLGTGAGTPTIQWTLNGAGSSDAPIQVTAAPGTSATFNLALSDKSAVCGYVYSLGVANVDGSEDPAASPSASFLSVSSPDLQSGTVAKTAATAAPTSASDTGAGNGYTPMDVTVPSTPGVYQAYVVVDSQTASGVATYGPANQTGGPDNGVTGNPGSTPLGAPGIATDGNPTYVPVCVTVKSGVTTPTYASGSGNGCPISTGTTSSPDPGTGTSTTVTRTTTTPAATVTTPGPVVTKPGATVTTPGATVTTPATTTIAEAASGSVTDVSVQTAHNQPVTSYYFRWQNGVSFGTSKSLAYITKEIAVYALPSKKQATIRITELSKPHGRIKFITPKAKLSHLEFKLDVHYLYFSAAERRYIKAHHITHVTGLFEIRVANGTLYKKTLTVKI